MCCRVITLQYFCTVKQLDFNQYMFSCVGSQEVTHHTAMSEVPCSITGYVKDMFAVAAPGFDLGGVDFVNGVGAFSGHISIK